MIPLSTGGKGLVAALELARCRARAPLLARMDADDVAHPERLRRQVDHLRRRPELAGTGSLVRLFPRGSLRLGWRRYERWQNSLVDSGQIRRERFVESPLVHPSVTMRAEALRRVGGYRERGWPEDYDLWLRLLESGCILDKVPRTLLFWRHRPQRLSLGHPRYDLERHREMKLHFLLQGELSRRRRVAIWGAGLNGRRWARLLCRSGIQVDCFIDIDSKKIGRTLHGITVMGPERVHGPELPFVLGAVASPGARPLIRNALLQAGKVEEHDFLLLQ